MISKLTLSHIQYLKEQRAGTATFLPLDTITPKPIDDKFRSFGHGSRLALDLLKFDQSNERAILFACGNALVCDTMESARQIAFGKGQQVKGEIAERLSANDLADQYYSTVVTLDGSVIHKTGNMTGGDDGKNNNRKWDDAEVAALKQQVEHYKTRLGELRQHRPKESDEDVPASKITTLETEVTGIKDDLSATKNSLQDSKAQCKDAQKKVDELQAKLDKVQGIVSESESRIEELNLTIAKATDRIFADFCKRTGLANIRVYEDHQNKQNQEQGEEILRMSKARDTFNNR